MDLLLDTHSIIWYSQNNDNLSELATQQISAYSNNCFVSIVSIWEMAIKLKLNKLVMKFSLHDFVKILEKNHFLFLPIKIEHTIRVSELELHHKDPFDRLLIAQAIHENYTIISNDSIFDRFSLKRIW